MVRYEFVPISQITLLEDNPREVTESSFTKLMEDIKADPTFLEQRPPLLNLISATGEKICYAGNQRVRAADRLGYSQIMCMIETDVPQDVQDKRTILDNVHAGRWDYDLLANGKWSDMPLNDWGVEVPQDWVKQPGQVAEDEGEVDITPISVLGDLYELNSHRVQCGSSVEADVVAKTLNGVKPILMVTDPPYGVVYDADWRNHALREDGTAIGGRAIGKVLNDDKVDWREAYVLFPGNVMYVWHAGRHAKEVAQNIEDCEFDIICQIIWAKSNFAIGRGDYHWKHEPCWYAVRKGSKHNWQGDRSQTTLWEINKPQKSETGHSTQKPIECMSKPIENNTSIGESVYDPFLGSGTTLIACEQLSRNCYGQELNPVYVDIIIRRYIKYMTDNNRPFLIKRNGIELSKEEVERFL